ncbi:hypothetical protein CF326_g648 [Tilletia indica]|nr:hypothetical protein CF326_g648 [Tilletia indica]
MSSSDFEEYPMDMDEDSGDSWLSSSSDLQDAFDSEGPIDWPEVEAAPADILELFHQLAASASNACRTIREILSAIPDIIRETRRSTITKHDGEAFCRRVLRYLKLLLEHQKGSEKLGAPGTLSGFLAAALLEDVETILHISKGVGGVVRRNRQRTQRRMEEVISAVRSDMLAAKNIIKPSTRSGGHTACPDSESQRAIYSLSALHGALQDLQVATDTEIEIDIANSDRSFPAMEVMNSLLPFFRGITLLNGWVPETDDDRVHRDEDDETLSPEEYFENDRDFTVNSRIFGVDKEEQTQGAICFVFRQARELELNGLQDSETAEQRRAPLYQALFVISENLSKTKLSDSGSIILKLSAAALALLQLGEFDYASLAMELAVVGIRDNLFRAPDSESNQCNLINALGALAIFLRAPCDSGFDGEDSEDDFDCEDSKAVHLPAEEALRLFQSLFEKDSKNHQQLLAAVEIEYALCLLARGKDKSSALADGLPAVEDAITIHRQTLPVNPSNKVRASLARALQVQSLLLYHAAGRTQDLGKASREAVDRYRQVIKQELGPYDFQYAEALKFRAGLYTEDSHEVLLGASAVYEKLRTTNWKPVDEQLSKINWMLGLYYRTKSNYEDAEACITRAIELKSDTIRDYEDVTRYTQERVFVRTMLEMYHLALKDARSSMASLLQARDREALAGILSQKGYCEWMLGDRGVGHSDLKKSVKIFNKISTVPTEGSYPGLLGDDNIDAIAWLGSLQCAMGDQESALRNGAESVRLARLSRASCRFEDDIHWADLNLARALVYWTATLLDSGRNDEAKASIDESIHLMRDQERKDSVFKTALLMKEQMLLEEGRTSEMAGVRAEADKIPFEGFLDKLGRSTT